LREGVIGEDHILAEIGEVAAGVADGRTHAEEITLFKSLGLAVEDLAAARWIHLRAIETGAGTPVPLG
jgi:alanine dehydrogenase